MIISSLMSRLMIKSPSGYGHGHLVFTGPVHWTEKMTKTKLNPTAKDWTTSCSCTNSDFFQLPVVRFVKKLKDQKNWSRLVETSFLSCHMLDLAHAHIYLISGF